MAPFEHERAPVMSRARGTVRPAVRDAGLSARGRVRPVHRRPGPVALASGRPTAPPGFGAEGGPPRAWSSPPGPGGFPLGAVRGRLGRSQTPQPVVDLGLVAPGPGPLAPLHLPVGFAVAEDGPARAVLFGTEGDH